MIEDNDSGQDSEGKLKLYIENVDFLLQNSVSKAQLDLGNLILYLFLTYKMIEKRLLQKLTKHSLTK